MVVEHLDRLSRNTIGNAIRLFLDILDYGITIVTLIDGKEYAKPVQMHDMMYSLMLFSQANQESEKKKVRNVESWGQKKLEARAGTVMSAHVPAWMGKQGDKIVLIPEKAKIVKEIFALSLKGFGRDWIVRHLNRTYPNCKFSRANHFYSSYVGDILTSRAAIGEYQPHRLLYDDAGKKQRVPDGEVIKGYYPAVIDEKTFYAVQSAFKGRYKGGGPVQKGTINIFQGMKDTQGNSIICKTSKSWRRMYFSTARNKGEKVCYFPGNQFDRIMFTLFYDYMRDPEQKDNGKDIKSLDGQIDEIDNKLTELSNLIETKPLATLVSAMERLEAKKAGLKRQKEEQIGKAGREVAGDLFSNWQGLLDGLLWNTLPTERRLQLRDAVRSRMQNVTALFLKEKRNYLAEVKVKFQDGTERLAAFKLCYLDYHKEGYRKENPYSWFPLMLQKQELSEVALRAAKAPAAGTGTKKGSSNVLTKLMRF